MKENADRARNLDAAELAKQMRDSAEQMFRLRFQMSMGQMEGLKKYRSLRRERARMLTVMKERESGREVPKAAVPSAPKPKAKAAPVAEPKVAKAAVKPKVAAKPKAAVKKVAAAPKTAAKPKIAQKPRKSSKG